MLLTDDLKKKAGIDRKMRRRSDEAQIAEFTWMRCARVATLHARACWVARILSRCPRNAACTLVAARGTRCRRSCRVLFLTAHHMVIGQMSTSYLCAVCPSASTRRIHGVSIYLCPRNTDWSFTARCRLQASSSRGVACMPSGSAGA